MIAIFATFDWAKNGYRLLEDSLRLILLTIFDSVKGGLGDWNLDSSAVGLHTDAAWYTCTGQQPWRTDRSFL